MYAANWWVCRLKAHAFRRVHYMRQQHVTCMSMQQAWIVWVSVPGEQRDPVCRPWVEWNQSPWRGRTIWRFLQQDHEALRNNTLNTNILRFQHLKALQKSFIFCQTLVHEELYTLMTLATICLHWSICCLSRHAPVCCCRIDSIWHLIDSTW